MLNIDSNFECIPLKWDTDYFGIQSARVNLTDIVDEVEQNQIFEFMKGFEFVTILNMNNASENNYWVGNRTNAFLADMNIQFVKVLENKPSFQDENTYVLNHQGRSDEIIDLSRCAFKYSRFFNDPKLPQVQAKNIYLYWTECAFNRDDKYFVVAKREEHVAGYILFSIHEHNSVIELIAVDKKYQGQGVGTSLIYKMESFVMDKGIKKIKVGTQVDNISAIGFYHAVGFQYVNCGSVYHLWKS